MSQNIRIGICFKLLNCLLFSILSIVIVRTAEILPVTQILFVRVSLGMLISAIYLALIKQKITFNLSRKDYLFYVARAIISFVAMQLSVYAMQYIGITEATALSYTGPFWIFLAARYMIGEPFSLSCLIAIAANMTGVIIILNPKLNNINWYGIAASLSAILLWVLYETICKKQTSNQHYMLQTFYVCFFATIIIAPFTIFKWHAIEAKTWGNLSLMAILGVANITSIFLAYSFASMMTLSPFSYARIIFTAFLAGWINHVTPTMNVFVGSAIIISINFYLAYKKKA